MLSATALQLRIERLRKKASLLGCRGEKVRIESHVNAHGQECRGACWRVSVGDKHFYDGTSSIDDLLTLAEAELDEKLAARISRARAELQDLEDAVGDTE